MDRQTVYYKISKVHFEIDPIDARIVMIWKSTTRFIDPDAVHVEQLRCTDGRTRLDGEKLWLDALGFIDTMTWLHVQRTNWTPKSFGRALSKFFGPGNAMEFDRTMRAACRAAVDLPAYGSSEYFKNRAIAAHCAEFAEMQATPEAARIRAMVQAQGGG